MENDLEKSVNLVWRQKKDLVSMLTDRDRFNEIYRVGYDSCWSNREISTEVTSYVDTLTKSSSLNKNSQILDLGCGSGRLLEYLEARGFTKVVGVDVSDTAIKFAKSRLQTPEVALVDVKNGLPFPDNTFDLVAELTFVSSLNPRLWPAIFKEIKRVLRNNGHFISEIFVRDQSNSETNNLYNPLVTKSSIPRDLDQVYGVTETELGTIIGRYFSIQDYMPRRPEPDSSYFVLARITK